MDEKRWMQEAMGRSLSGLKENPFLAQAVLERAKEEKKMKKKIPGGLALALALILALMGTAYAAMSSQVAEFFGQFWNRDLGSWLQGGRMARIGETVAVGDVSFTLEEVVYRSRGLYGVGKVRALNEKDVLLPMDWANELELFLTEGEMIQTEENEAIQAQVKKARETGGRLLTGECTPGKIGVDGGEMLTPGCIGYYDRLNPDGSMTFSFEVEDGFSLAEGARYTLLMKAAVMEVKETGGSDLDTRREETWTVEFSPVAMADSTAAPEGNKEKTVSFVPEGYELLVPAEYREEGTLPVYRASASDFGRIIRPEWFNSSGTAEYKTNGSGGNCLFQDGARLQYGPESIYYCEYTEELFDYAARERESNPNAQPDWGHVPALSAAIARLASDAYGGAGESGEKAKLESEALARITLKEAQAAAEDLLAKLNIRGFECAWALDMSAERIHSLGEAYNAYWFGGKGYTNQPRFDYSAAAEEDEGYFLLYCPLGVDQASQGRFAMSVYVTARGVVYAQIRSDYQRDEIAFVPESLITPQQALDCLREEAAHSRRGGTVAAVRRVALTYGAARAEKKEEGMVFVPMWQVLYQDESAVREGYLCYAEINAVDGKLMDAIFQ